MDISVYDNYSGKYPKIDLSLYSNELFLDNSMYVIICRDGFGRYRFHLEEIELDKGSMMLIPPKVPFRPTGHGGPYKFDVIRVGKEHFDIIDDVTLWPQFEHLLSGIPIFHLDEIRLRMGHIIFLYLGKLNIDFVTADQEERLFIKQIAEGYLKVMLMEICHLVHIENSSLKSHVRQDNISGIFFKELSASFRSRKNVPYYSSKIGLTPKKLTAIIRDHTGKTPSEWIDEFTLIESKRMLKTLDMTIQEISYDLNFATPSYFTHFFKKKTGMTPSQYRESVNSL